MCVQKMRMCIHKRYMRMRYAHKAHVGVNVGWLDNLYEASSGTVNTKLRVVYVYLVFVVRRRRV